MQFLKNEKKFQVWIAIESDGVGDGIEIARLINYHRRIRCSSHLHTLSLTLSLNAFISAEIHQITTFWAFLFSSAMRDGDQGLRQPNILASPNCFIVHFHYFFEFQTFFDEFFHLF